MLRKLGEARTDGPGPLEAHPAGPGQNSLCEMLRNWETDPEPRAATGWDPFIIYHIHLHFLDSLRSFGIYLISSEFVIFIWIF